MGEQTGMLNCIKTKSKVRRLPIEPRSDVHPRI